MNPDDLNDAIAFLNDIPEPEWERVCGDQGRPEFARLTLGAGQDIATEWQIAQLQMGELLPGLVFNYQTNKYMRRATVDEHAESLRAAVSDDGRGLIIVDGIACFVY